MEETWSVTGSVAIYSQRRCRNGTFAGYLQYLMFVIQWELWQQETGGIGLQDCLGLHHGPAGGEPWLKQRVMPRRLGRC